MGYAKRNQPEQRFVRYGLDEKERTQENQQKKYKNRVKKVRVAIKVKGRIKDTALT